MIYFTLNEEMILTKNNLSWVLLEYYFILHFIWKIFFYDNHLYFYFYIDFILFFNPNCFHIKILFIIARPKEGAETSPIKDGSETLTKQNASMDIVFHNVWFKYPLESSKWVLRNFNLTIKGGQKIGLIGESGCGKSTIVQLLLRFYDPQEGEITINGINIQELNISSLRSMFGLVQQEPVLFK